MCLTTNQIFNYSKFKIVLILTQWIDRVCWETLQRKHLETIDTSCICRLLPIITHLILEPEKHG